MLETFGQDVARPGRLAVDDAAPPVVGFLQVASVAGAPVVVSAGGLAVARFRVVNLRAFVFVVADGVPLCSAVSGNDAFEPLLATTVQEEQQGGDHGKDSDQAKRQGRGRSVNVDQGVGGVVLSELPTTDTGLCVDVGQSFDSGRSGGVAVGIPENVEELETHG